MRAYPCSTGRSFVIDVPPDVLNPGFDSGHPPPPPPPEGWEGDPSNLPVAAVQSGADLPSHHSPDRSGPRNRGGTLNGLGELLVGWGKAELSPFF